jgi:hypothetical protein
MEEAPTGDGERGSPAPCTTRVTRFVRAWPHVRTGLQLAQLGLVTHDGLCLAAQAVTLIGEVTWQVLSDRR